jgi:hypothetical protein
LVRRIWRSEVILRNLITGKNTKSERGLCAYQNTLESEANGNRPFMANLHARNYATIAATSLRLFVVNQVAGKVFPLESNENGELGTEKNAAAPLRELYRVKDAGKWWLLKIEQRNSGHLPAVAKV